MTTTADTVSAPPRFVRIGRSEYGEPFASEEGLYPRGTVLVAVYEDGGDRYVTRCPDDVLDAWAEADIFGTAGV